MAKKSWKSIASDMMQTSATERVENTGGSGWQTLATHLMKNAPSQNTSAQSPYSRYEGYYQKAASAAPYAPAQKSMSLPDQLAETEKQLKAVRDRNTQAKRSRSGTEDTVTERQLRQQAAQLRAEKNWAESDAYTASGTKALGELSAGSRAYLETLAKLGGGAYQTPDTDYFAGSMSGRYDNGTVFDVDPATYAENADVQKARIALRQQGYSDGEIEQLVDYRRRQINREDYDAAMERMRQYAAERPVGASATSVLTNMGGGFGTLDALHQKITHPERPIDFYSPEMTASGMTNAIRGQVSQDIRDNAKTELGGKVGSFLYQTGMSMADSGVNALIAMAGLPQGVGLSMLGGSASTTAMREAKERGLTDNQALGMGLVAGAAEIVTEKIGLDTFLDTAFGKGGKRAAVAILKNVLAEGGEEVGSDVINLAADVLIAKDQSEWSQSIAAYMEKGMSREAATRRAILDQLGSMAVSFAGGALSGGVFGGVGVGINNIRAKGLYGADSAALVQEALDIDPENKIAQRAQRRLEQGKELPGKTLRTLMEMNEARIEDESHKNTAPQSEAANKEDAREVVAKLQKSIADMDGMAPVSELRGNEFPKGAKKLTEQVGDFFRSIGNAVSRKGLGTVVLDERGVKTDIAHGIGRAKAITFAAVPGVIENGREIDRQKNWKGRGYDTYVYAAPVTLAGKTTYVAAVVRSGKNNRFYLHEVVDGDGNLIYKVEEDPAAIKTGVTANDGRVTGTAGSSENTVSQSVNEVKSGEPGAAGQAVYGTVRQMAPELDEDTFRAAFNVAYEIGRQTADAENGLQGLETARESLSGTAMPDGAVETIYYAGREDMRYARQEGEKQHEREGIPVRKSGQRADGADPGGAGERLASRPAQAERIGRRSAARDSGANSVRYGSGEKSSADLIGNRGSKTDKLRVVTGGFTVSMQKAKALAEKRGLTAYFYTGGYMHVDDVECRGFIRGNTVYIRVDDPLYNAEQIMRHELGHDAIRKGEIDPAVVLERLEQRFGDDAMEAVIDYYAAAYEGSGMSGQEIWDEIICDSLGDMGAFAEDLRTAAPQLAKVLEGVNGETVANAYENRNKGQQKTVTGEGDGKMSIARTSKMTLEEQIREYHNGKLRGSDSFFFGNTPDSMKEIGFDSNPLVMNLTDYEKSVKEKHNVKRRNILGLMEHLKAPVMAVGKPGNMAVIVDDVDGQAKPLLVAIHDGATEDRAPANRIASIYGIDNMEAWLDSQIKRNADFVIYDKSKADKLLSSYSHNATLESKIRFADKSISDNEIKSNPQNEEGSFSRVVETDADALARENEELQQRVKDFRKALKETEKKLEAKTEQAAKWKGRALFRPESVGKEILRAYSSTLAETEIHDGVKALIDQAARRDGFTYAQLKELAAPVAAKVVKSAAAVANSEEAQTWQAMKEYWKGSRIKVSQAIINDIDEWGAFWRKNGRRLNLVTSKDGTPVDVAYAEMGERFGKAYFPEEITHPADQLRRMAEVYDNLRPVLENPYSLNMAMAAEHCANDLVDMVMGEVARGYKATYTGQLQEQVYQNRKHTEQLLRKERERSAAQVQALTHHWREENYAQLMRREDSEMRQRLLKVARRLKNKKLPSASRALLNQYAKEMLTAAQQKFFAEMDTEGVSMRKSTRNELQFLKDEYEHLLENDPNFIPEPATEERIRRLSKRQIETLTQDEVTDLAYALLYIENQLKYDQYLIDSKERRDLTEAGVQVMRDLENAPGSAASGVKSAIDRLIVTQTLSPLRQVKRMVGYVEGDPLLVATQELADGQRKSFDYYMRAQARFLKFTENKALMKRITGKDAQTVTIQGIGKDGPTTVEITPAMKISLYLHSKNNQSLTHIAGGGITVPDMKLYRQGKIAEAYARGTTVGLEPAQVRKVAASLNAEEMALAEAVYSYFNTMSKTEINAVSEKLLGYPVAEVENYFPINTDDSFTQKDFEAIKFDGSIEGMGFLKERIKSASPIYLRDVTAVLEQSIEQHARYVGLGVPVRNFNKLWGVTAKTFDNEGGPGASRSVQQLVRRQWGETGRRYIEKMMADVQGTARETNEWAQALAKIRSRYAGAVLMLNLSVAMKQAASYPTAAAVVGWKPLIKAFGNIGKVNENLIAKYTPLLWYRSQGFSTRELGDITKRGMKLPPALNWVQGVDLLTTRTLWKAAEYYVQEQQPNLQRGTAEDIREGKSPYYKAVAEVYNAIIEETQPNYTTMQRPQLLRSDDTLLQNLQMFKTQSFQNFNILYDAIGTMRAKERAWKVSPTEDNRKALQQAKKKAVWAVTSQAAQLAVFAGMTLAWNLFRGKKDKYKDDEGDVTALSVMRGVALDMLGGLFAEVPFGGDVWELGSSAVSGGRYYGIDDVTASALTDAGKAVVNAGKVVSGMVKSVAAGEEIDLNILRLKLDGVADALTKVLGWPYENVVNLGKAMFLQTAKLVQGDVMGEYAYLRLTTDPDLSKAPFYDLLWEAYRKRDKSLDDLYKSMLDSGDFDEKGIKSAMETRMKKAEGVGSVKDLKQRWSTS